MKCSRTWAWLASRACRRKSWTVLMFSSDFLQRPLMRLSSPASSSATRLSVAFRRRSAKTELSSAGCATGLTAVPLLRCLLFLPAFSSSSMFPCSCMMTSEDCSHNIKAHSTSGHFTSCSAASGKQRDLVYHAVLLAGRFQVV